MKLKEVCINNKGFTLLEIIGAMIVFSAIFLFIMNNFMTDMLFFSKSNKVCNGISDVIVTEKSLVRDLNLGIDGIELLEEKKFNINGVVYCIDDKGLLRTNQQGYDRYVYEGNVSIFEDIIDGNKFLNIDFDGRSRLFKLNGR